MRFVWTSADPSLTQRAFANAVVGQPAKVTDSWTKGGTVEDFINRILDKLSPQLTNTLVADIGPGHMMRPHLTVAASLPALGLGGEAFVALDVVRTEVAQFLGNRMTLLGVVLSHGHVSRATDTDPVWHLHVQVITDGVRWTLGLTLAGIGPWKDGKETSCRERHDTVGISQGLI